MNARALIFTLLFSVTQFTILHPAAALDSQEAPTVESDIVKYTHAAGGEVQAKLLVGILHNNTEVFEEALKLRAKPGLKFKESFKFYHLHKCCPESIWADRPETPFLLACYLGRSHFVEELVSNNKDLVNQPGGLLERTPLMYATEGLNSHTECNLETIKVLRKNGADLRAYLKTKSY